VIVRELFPGSLTGHVANHILYAACFTLADSMIFPDNASFPGHRMLFSGKSDRCLTASLMRNRRKEEIELHEPLMM
jgi:hypothetical protein